MKPDAIVQISAQVQFIKHSNGLYNYRLSSITYYNNEPIIPLHNDVVRNVSIDELRQVFQPLVHNPYLIKINCIKSRNGTKCVEYVYDFNQDIEGGNIHDPY